MNEDNKISRDAIAHLLSAYCHALDERRFEVMADLFTNDATVTTRFAGSVHRGPESICDFLRSQPESMRGLHLTINPEIDVLADGARVRSDFVVIAPRPSLSLIAAWGWYRDLIVLDRGAWRFQERHIETQWRMDERTTPAKEIPEGQLDRSPLGRSPDVEGRVEQLDELIPAETSIRRLSDELDIRNLVARIAHTADMSEALDGYLACFAEGAIWDFGGNQHEGIGPARVQGRDAIRADRLERRERGVQGPGTANRHVITTLSVEVNDDGTARADSYFLLLTDTTATPRIRNVGHYFDTFTRTPEGWQLASRKITTG